MEYKGLPKELIDEAKKNPNGYVYVIDKQYVNRENVPPEFIKGVWKVDENGIIVVDFIKNENYHKPTDETNYNST